MGESEAITAAVRFQQTSLTLEAHDGTKEILQNITQSIGPGKIVTLVGPSGSGKSTLLSLCNLLRTPTFGSVFIDGTEVREWSVSELRRKVGLVFQTPTMFPGTVLANLQIGPKLRGERLTNPEKYLAQVGLHLDLLEQQANELSGGQKQRVALARVLCNEPDILLLDEVTSALDPSAASEVEKTILELHQKTHNTVLWVTHQLEQAERVGDETWLLVDGQLIESAPTRDFFINPRHEMTRKFIDGQLAGGDDA